MRTGFFAWLGALLFVLGCTAAEKPAPTPASVIRGSGPFAFPAIDDNLAHDTLLIQTTFDLGDMTYLMVASNMEETFEGLRLYRYRFAADSAVEMMAVSSPAYDSWTMLPTFFGADSTDTQALWVLANFGEKESWGQKLIWLERDFSDRGFMHVALPERVIEDDTLRLKRRNVAPHMRYSVQGDTSVWRFSCDSVFLYEDGSGGTDLIVAAPRVRYSYHRDQGLVLWVDGQARPVRSPA